MTITLTNPEALPKVDFFRQVAIASGSKLVFMAGQVAWDADGSPGRQRRPRRAGRTVLPQRRRCRRRGRRHPR